MMSAFLKIREFIEKQSNLNILFFIIVLTFLCYINIFFGHEFIVYDDDWYIYKNKNVINLSWSSIIESFTSTKEGQYSPIAEVYHAIIYFFFEKNAIAFKFFALLTHLLNVVLVFKLFSYLSSNRWLVIFVSLVFAIHPLQVETIGWLSVIYRIAVLFMLLGYVFYCKYIQSNYNWRYLALAITFYILALFTKEQAILFPIGLVLINLKKGIYLLKKRIIYENILFGLMAVTFALITVEITKEGGPSIIEREVSFFGNIALLSESIIAYLYNFLLPINLSLIYPYPLTFVPTPMTYFRLFVALCIVVIAAIAFIKNKQYRFGIFWTFGFLSIAFSFPFYNLRESFMADRYTYFATIGLAYTLFLVLKKTHILQVFGSLFILMLIVITINRVPVFKSSYSLFKDALKKNNKNHFAYANLGFQYKENGDFNKAIRSYKKSLALYPNNTRAHINLGEVYFKMKKYEDALKHTNILLELSPNSIRGYSNRVAINSDLNRNEEAIKDLDYLLTKEPSNVKFLMTRAVSYFKLRNFENSIEDCKKILLIKDHEYAFYLLGHSQFLLNQYKAAEENLTKAIAMDNKKGNYYFFRSHSRLSLGKYDLAHQDVLNAQKYKHPVSQSYFERVTSLTNR